MRERKFRALRKHKGKPSKSSTWFYFDLKTNDEMFPEILWETVGDYTGLKDKNGKEIYEEDLWNSGYEFRAFSLFGKPIAIIANKR